MLISEYLDVTLFHRGAQMLPTLKGGNPDFSQILIIIKILLIQADRTHNKGINM